jgi:hypothetical protein
VLIELFSVPVIAPMEGLAKPRIWNLATVHDGILWGVGLVGFEEEVKSLP